MLITRLICIQWKSSRFLSPVSTVSARNAWDHDYHLGKTRKKNRLHFWSLALIKQARLMNEWMIVRSFLLFSCSSAWASGPKGLGSIPAISVLSFFFYSVLYSIAVWHGGIWYWLFLGLFKNVFIFKNIRCLRSPGMDFQISYYRKRVLFWLPIILELVSPN